ncbi:MAG: protein kinase [Candidatus Odinarchaeota archaeon]
MIREEEFLDAFKSALEDKDYIYLEPMNKSGGWAEIFYVYSREDKEVRVAKVYKEELGRITEEIYKSDAKKLMKIEHQNVVKIIDRSIIEYDGKKYFFLILEHIKGKNFEEIDSRLFFEKPYKERLNYFVQTLDGINEFRENFDLHRDLHPGNIMLSDEDKYNVRKIKIIDPGSSRYYYEPKDEDIDLYSIKEGLLNLFLRPDEINQINERIELKTLAFPELRELIMNLSIEVEKKPILYHPDTEIDTDNIGLLLEQLEEEREDIYEEIGSIDSNRKHLTFSLAVVPIKLNPESFDFNDEKTITVIKNLNKNLIFNNPYGGMYDFDEFLRDFIFHGNWYQADHLINSDMLFNFGRTKIHKNGIISITIAINAFTVEALRGSILFLKQDEKLLNSLWISTDLLAYLLIVWLKLIRIIYSKLYFHGILKLMLNIYSGWDLSLTGKKRVLLGNNINPKSEIDIKISDLKDNNELLRILKAIIKELLRYFNIDIDQFDQGYNLFEETIERYFNIVFNNNEKIN